MQTTLDRLLENVHHLERAAGDPELSLAAAKRVQKTVRVLVQELAAQRDQTLQSQEDTSNADRNN